jgi:hypothetical protein
MRMPRVSIAWLMAVVLLAAANFAALRVLFAPAYDERQGAFVIGLLPTANLVALAAASVTRHLVRERRGRSFEVGFLVSGLLVLTTLACLFALTECEIIAWYLVQLEPMIASLGHLGVDTNSRLGAGFLLVVQVGLPQWALTLAGGLIARRLGIEVVVARRVAPAPEAEATA